MKTQKQFLFVFFSFLKNKMNACVSTAALLLLLGLGADAAAPDLTVDNFETTLSGKSGVWVLDFYAPWCGSRTHPPTRSEGESEKQRGRERAQSAMHVCLIGTGCAGVGTASI
jgi:hypothetical protein